jgi:hypothetical protein
MPAQIPASSKARDVVLSFADWTSAAALLKLLIAAAHDAYALSQVCTVVSADQL